MINHFKKTCSQEKEIERKMDSLSFNLTLLFSQAKSNHYLFEYQIID